MIPNNNLSPLAWYTSLQDQNHRKEWAYGKVFPLISQSRVILPFQVIRNHIASTPISSFILVNFETGEEFNITTEITTDNLVIKEFTEYDIILNYGKFLLPETFSFKGLFYCKMTDGVNLWYSEVFNFIQDIAKYVKVVWYNRNDIFEFTGGHIDYNDGYQNYIYINTEIGKPEYTFTEEVSERDGYTFPEKQISEKVFKFDFLAPEFVLDAMRIIRMHDYIFVQQNDKLWDVEQFMISSEWEEQGDLATVECEFHVDTVMKKIGKGFDTLPIGDYNDDFNNDFSGGVGEGGIDYDHYFEFMSGSTELGAGLIIHDWNIEIKVKSSGAIIYDGKASFDSFHYQSGLGTGITYEITFSREGYITKTFDFLNGGTDALTSTLVEEDPTTINYTLNIVGYDGAVIPFVDVTGTTYLNNNVIVDENTGATGIYPFSLKKGVYYFVKLNKAGYNESNYDLGLGETIGTDTIYISMTPS